MDIKLTAKGNRYFRLRSPGVPVSDPPLSQHNDVASAYEAAVKHAVANGIDGIYTVQPPDRWEIETMGFKVVTVPPPGVVGQLWLVASSYSGTEGQALSFVVRRGGGSSGAVAVDWSITGLSEGSPSPATGTVNWADGESGDKTVTVTLGLVTADQSGTLTLSNPRSTSGGAAPTITSGTAVIQVTDVPTNAEPFVPLVEVDFDGLTAGSAIGSVENGTGVAGKRFDYWGYFANGFGSRAVASNQLPGKATCAELSIQQGNNGGLGGGTGPNGSFGGGFGAATFPPVYNGETIWIAMQIRIPAGFSFLTNTGFLKFLRITQRNAAGVGNGGKLELHIKHNSAGAGVGFNLASEITPNSQSRTLKDCDRRIYAADTYQQICIALKAGDAANSMRRVWVDGRLSYERIAGRYNKWFENGEWKTEDIVALGSNAEPTLADTGGSLSGLMLFTYWNGNAPQTQSLNVQRLVFHKDEATLNGVDEFGNRFIDLDAGAAPSTYAPARIVSFDGLANNASVDGDTGIAGKRFDWWGKFANGYGAKATTSVKRPGKTSSAQLSIRQGSAGGIGGGGGGPHDTDGSFGGGFTVAPEHEAVQGEWLHAGVWIYLPENFSVLTNTTLLKFWRWQRHIGAGSPVGGKTEVLFLDGSWTWSGPAGPAGSIQGFCTTTEGAGAGERDNRLVCSRLPGLGQWNFIEMAVLAHSVGANAAWRIWVNDQFCMERVGNVNKWYGRKYNALGSPPALQTATWIGSAVPTLTGPTEKLYSPMLFTYWNGNAPQDQSVYIDSLCYAKNVGAMTATDEFGNKMMGSGVLP